MKKVPLPKDLRNPLPHIPIREEPIEEPIFGLSETKDRDLQKKILSNIGIRPTAAGSSALSAAVDDSSLVAAMANRLRRAESELKTFREELRKKEQSLTEAKLEIQNLKKKMSSSVSSSVDMAMLTEHNAKLRKQVESMEQFFKDYDMTWIGDAEESEHAEGDVDFDELVQAKKKKDGIRDSNDNLLFDGKPWKYPPGVVAASAAAMKQQREKEKKPDDGNIIARRRSTGDIFEQQDESSSVKSSLSLSPTPEAGDKTFDQLGFDVDIKHIQNIVNQLNLRCGAHISSVAKGPDGVSRLVLPDAVSITMYRNGIMFEQGPFRPFSDGIAAINVIKDLVDGYFPSELKTRYPHGVPLNFKDESWRNFTRMQFEAFMGKGYKLGGGKAIEPKPPTHPVVPRHGGNIDARKLINRLPARVVKQGKVIEIRDEIAERLGHKPASNSNNNNNNSNSNSNELTIPSHVLADIEKIADPGTMKNDQEKATLLIKSHDNKRYTISLPSYARICHLRAIVKQICVDGFVLSSSFPAKRLDDDLMTLKEAGLTPNATIHVQTTD